MSEKEELKSDDVETLTVIVEPVVKTEEDKGGYRDRRK